jgi:hypothetical protein
MSMKVILLFVAVAFAFLAFSVTFFGRTPPPAVGTVNVIKVHPVDPSARFQKDSSFEAQNLDLMGRPIDPNEQYTEEDWMRDSQGMSNLQLEWMTQIISMMNCPGQPIGPNSRYKLKDFMRDAAGGMAWRQLKSLAWMASVAQCGLANTPPRRGN